MSVSHNAITPPILDAEPVTLGYVRLTDAAPLIMAQELGLYRRHGLAVELVRERSWASLRDKLLVGLVDAAQLLAPLALYASAGVGSPATPLLSGLALGRNGNAVAVSKALAAELGLSEPWRQPQAAANALAACIERRQHNQQRPLRLATVHPFSVHTIQWSQLLRAGGADWRQTRLVVLPPEQMVDALAAGEIDAFNAGAPWFAVAVAHGVGELLVTGADIWPDAPEKLLAVSASWHERYPERHQRLRLAVMEALAWLAEPDHRRQTAEVLARPEYLNLPSEQLLPLLTGVVQGAADTPPYYLPQFHSFDGGVSAYPWPAHGLRCLAELASIAALPQGLTAEALVASVYRPDLYASAAHELGWSLPVGGGQPPVLGSERPVDGGEKAHSGGA